MGSPQEVKLHFFVPKDIVRLMRNKKTIMIMVDGFGVPKEGWLDSVFARLCVDGFAELMSEYSVPIDPGMGVPGVPQSATGQTALFTGENAAALMNGHVQGFPGPTLREVIERGNVFSRLMAKGLKVAFANAYVRYSLQELAKLRRRSVTTVMTETALGYVRDARDLVAGKAVYHDLTRTTVSKLFGTPEISPLEAAEDLLGVASENDFTLFEYFLTDRAGHKGDLAFLAMVLLEFSEFFIRLIDLAAGEFVVALTSDHGNCEEPGTKGHTRNPVPFFLHGAPVPVASGDSVQIEDALNLLPGLA